ncbi:E3 ubiquitin-protein ligase TRIM21-like [Cheilinus undulatus]|uniref:E3 ubiquitin-protein ligase TRIM21-like n=1 Tax=Cheilinus undulatus TaxID=241271 RepID=UPI001BD5D9AA|nr:E3 ubiquitin-protein ligase TRIM21-like [Cheilinus undulatus]
MQTTLSLILGVDFSGVNMPHHSLPLREDFLLCSICQDVFTHPVTTPCGHTFCKSCITDHWGPRVPCQCPTCEKVFNTAPHMEVNTVVSEMAAQFKQSAEQKDERNKLTEVLCDVLRATMMKDVTSCLEFLVCVFIVWMVLGPNSLGLVPLREEYDGMKLEKLEAEIQEMIQRKQQKIEEIRHSVEISQTHFQEFTESVERSLKHFIDRVDERQRKAEAEAEGFIRELEQEISELKKRSSDIEQLSVTQLDESLSKEIQKQMKRMFAEAEMKRFQQYAVDLTLDPDTAHPYLILSDDGKQVHHGDVQQRVLTDHGFDTALCVLSQQSFSSGRFYFEVQVKGKTCWDLGVAEESIYLMEQIILTPEDGYWTIGLRNGDEYKARSDPPVRLSLQSCPEKVGVFVDYTGRLVSFYDVDTAALIYSFTRCPFRERLYPFFSPCPNDGGRNSAPLVISPVRHTG